MCFLLLSVLNETCLDFRDMLHALEPPQPVEQSLRMLRSEERCRGPEELLRNLGIGLVLREIALLAARLADEALAAAHGHVDPGVMLDRQPAVGPGELVVRDDFDFREQRA